MSRRWISQETALLRTAWKGTGATDAQLGEILNRSAGAISNRRSLIGAVKYTKMKKSTSANGSPAGPLFTENFCIAADQALRQPYSKIQARAIDTGEGTNKKEITVREIFEMPDLPTGAEAFFKIGDCGRVEFQAIGIPPRRVAAILANIISKIV